MSIKNANLYWISALDVLIWSNKSTVVLFVNMIKISNMLTSSVCLLRQFSNIRSLLNLTVHLTTRFPKPPLRRTFPRPLSLKLRLKSNTTIRSGTVLIGKNEKPSLHIERKTTFQIPLAMVPVAALKLSLAVAHANLPKPTLHKTPILTCQLRKLLFLPESSNGWPQNRPLKLLQIHPLSVLLQAIHLADDTRQPVLNHLTFLLFPLVADA